ncbi:MAG: hypothetical protein IKO32_05560, partial [Lachnospiraceae bacterium]|nr:hypothetical protein [Lachnospiraceae bacterium]
MENGSGKVHAEEAEFTPPLIQDSSSAINYSTILGRGVDFGIIADNFLQSNHMQSTFAVKTYSNNGQNNDINLIADNATAQVLVGGVDTTGGAPAGETIQIHSVTGKVLNIECTTGLRPYFDLQSGVEEKTFITENDATLDNIQRMIDNAFEKSASLERKAKNSDYAINYREYMTDGKTLDLTQGDFENKVVYIDADSNLLNLLAGNGDTLKIVKESSTVVVINVSDDAGSNLSGDRVRINKYELISGGTEINTNDYSGSYVDDPTNGTRMCDREACQKIIFNVTTSRQVDLMNTSALVLVPNSPLVYLSGTCAGWIVTNNMDIHAEWHYIYGGGNQNYMTDVEGEIHFAARKSFTHNWDGKGTAEDTTIYSPADTYSFMWYENEEGYGIEEPANYDVIKNTGTNKLTFPKLKFFTDADKAAAEGLSSHYIPEGEDNAKKFYYTIREIGAGTVNADGIYLSKGKINIELTVKNIGGKLQYFVTSTTYLDNDQVYKTNSNIRMSGVEFSLGAFFNRTTTSLRLGKTVEGNCDAAKTANYTFYVQDARGNYFDVNGNNKGSVKTPIIITPGQEVTVKNLPDGKYTVSEDPTSAMQDGYTLIAPEPVTTTAGSSATPFVKLNNKYINETSLAVKKNFSAYEGDVPPNLRDMEFKFYVESLDYPGMYLDADGKLTSEKTLITVKGNESVTINSMVAGEYKVTEAVEEIHGLPNDRDIMTSYTNQTVEISETNPNASSEITNMLLKKNELAIVIDKRLEGIEPGNEEFEFRLYYIDKNTRQPVYVGADGRKGNANTTIKVKAGTPVVIKSVADENTNGIWGSKYNTNGTTYILEEIRKESITRGYYYNAQTYYLKSVEGDGESNAVTLKNDDAQKAFVVTNTYQLYDLTIDKKVNIDALNGTDCQFVVKGTVNYPGWTDTFYVTQDGKKEYDQNKAIITVKAGTPLTLKGSGVVAGQYEVKEISPTVGSKVEKGSDTYILDNVDPSTATVNVTLNNSNPFGNATITNNFIMEDKLEGQLSIKKIKGDSSDDFPEGITMFPVSVTFDQDGEFLVDDVYTEFYQGLPHVFRIPLGGEITITGIPEGVTYEVNENLSGSDYDGFESPVLTYSDDTKTIADLDKDKVTVANTYTIPSPGNGPLSIGKTFTGDVTAQEKAGGIKFEVTTGTGVDQKWLDKDGTLIEAQTFLTLADFTDNGNDTYTKSWPSVPVGEYTVTETYAEIEGYTVSVSYASSQSGKTNSVEVTETGAAHVEITDDYTLNTGDLVIEKSIAGNNLTESEINGALTFTVKDNTTNKYLYKENGVTRYSDTAVELVLATDFTQPTAAGGTYTLEFEGLPENRTYTITETNADAPGYNLESVTINGTQ